ncbi:hypothetical protein SUZIE_202585 [Sciurus carolinensis]|uniref:Uncharacterized protein n=1 Tax=Sciurus carolinensis TaxID=30640 RepID=A0AA41T5X5_SCICA|nr:hypothetical protein [Sciurus carolinensis]
MMGKSAKCWMPIAASMNGQSSSRSSPPVVPARREPGAEGDGGVDTPRLSDWVGSKRKSGTSGALETIAAKIANELKL